MREDVLLCALGVVVMTGFRLGTALVTGIGGMLAILIQVLELTIHSGV